MTRRLLRSLSLVAALVHAPSAHAEVHIIGTGGESTSGYGFLQDTIDAAADGDVIILEECRSGFIPSSCLLPLTEISAQWLRTFDTHREGTYAGIPATGALVIDNKALTIVGHYGQGESRPVIGGPVLILGDKQVRFRGIEFWGRPGLPQHSADSIDAHNVRIVDSNGLVHFEECSFQIGSPFTILSSTNYLYESSAAIELDGGSAELILSRCYVAGKGASFQPAGNPKHAVATISGAHRIAIYDSILLAGNGGGTDEQYLYGANAVSIGDDSVVHLFGSTLTGGPGYAIGGDGGHGLAIADRGAAYVTDSELIAGYGGFFGGGSPGEEIAAPEGAVTLLEGTARSVIVDPQARGLIEGGEEIVIEHSDAATAASPQVLVQAIGPRFDFVAMPLAGSIAGIAHVPSAFDVGLSVHQMLEGSLTTSIPTLAAEPAQPVLFFAQSAFQPASGEGTITASSPSFGVIVAPDLLPYVP